MGAKPLNVVGDFFTLGMAGLTAADAAAKARKDQQALMAKQSADALALEKRTLEAPKQIGSDNFMAGKASQLAKLRLGMSSTITGAGMSAPMLAPASQGKQKLGL